MSPVLTTFSNHSTSSSPSQATWPCEKSIQWEAFGQARYKFDIAWGRSGWLPQPSWPNMPQHRIRASQLRARRPGNFR
jgi:hypothetical protein